MPRHSPPKAPTAVQHSPLQRMRHPCPKQLRNPNPEGGSVAAGLYRFCLDDDAAGEDARRDHKRPRGAPIG